MFLSDRYRDRAESLLSDALKCMPRDGGLTRRDLENDPDLRTIWWRLGPALKRTIPIDSGPSSKDSPSY